MKIKFCLIFAFGICATTFGEESWQNPVPTGNTIFDACFFDQQKVIAFGDNATCIMSSDGGNNWQFSLLNSVQGSSLQAAFIDSLNGAARFYGSVFFTDNGGRLWMRQKKMMATSSSFIDLKIGWKVGRDGSIEKTTDGGATWISQNSGTGAILNLVCFADAKNGWAAGEAGAILRTVNGGSNWNVEYFEGLANGSGKYSWRAMYFTDSLSGLLIGRPYTDHDSIVMLRTKDGGNIWEKHTGYLDTSSFGSNTALFDIIAVADSMTFFICGNDSSIWKTIDGGLTWNKMPNKLQCNISSMNFCSTTVGWIFGYDGEIYKTKDGGASWVNQQKTATRSAFLAVSFADSNRGVAVGKNGIIVCTSNGGSHWQLCNSPISTDLTAVNLIDNIGWAIGVQGIIVKTTDYGQSWLLQQSFQNCTLNGILAITKTKVIAVGDSGIILKTTDGGQNWTLQNAGTTKTLYSICVKDTEYWIAGESGTLIKSKDGGTHWALDSLFVSNGFYSNANFHSIYFAGPQNGLVITEPIAGRSFNSFLTYKTSDGGSNWSIVDLTSSLRYPISAQLLNSNVEIALTTTGVYKSGNGGLSWDLMSNLLTPFPAAAMFFLNPGSGWIVGPSGKILKYTDNSSESNRPLPKQTHFLAQKIHFTKHCEVVSIVVASLGSNTADLKLFNCQGKVINQMKLHPSHGLLYANLDLATFPSGIYYCQITEGITLKTGYFIWTH
jgi:photosystem II stability/assembly factor-like uncharacterized protein